MKKIWMFFLIPPAIALMIWVGGELVMHLWNWLAPTIFGWKAITFWQAFGLLALCRILFGGWGGHGGHNRSWHHGRGERWGRAPEEREKFFQEMRERWGGKTPEEREKFFQQMRERRCGHPTPHREPSEPAS